MWHRCKNNCAFLPSRLARALWIEDNFQTAGIMMNESRLARALWIEDVTADLLHRYAVVEARESLVDRRLSIP